MASTYGILGQAALAADTLTDVFEVPAGKYAIVSSVLLCNRSATPTTYRLGWVPGGEPADDKHYAPYDAPLTANEIWGFTVGATLGPGDVIRAYAGDATVSLTIFGELLDI